MELASFEPEAAESITKARSSPTPVEDLLLMCLESRGVRPALEAIGTYQELATTASDLGSIAMSAPDPAEQVMALVSSAVQTAAAAGRTTTGSADLLVAAAQSKTVAGAVLRAKGLDADQLRQILDALAPHSGSFRLDSTATRTDAPLSDVDLYLSVESTELVQVVAIARTVALGPSGQAELLAIEIRSGGALLSWRARHDEHIIGVPQLVVTDGLQTRYRSVPAWLEGVAWARRGGSVFAPAPEDSAVELELRFPSIKASTGVIRVALGDR